MEWDGLGTSHAEKLFMTVYPTTEISEVFGGRQAEMTEKRGDRGTYARSSEGRAP